MARRAIGLLAAALACVSGYAQAQSTPPSQGPLINSYQDLVQLIQGNGTTAPIRSLDELLERLAADHPKNLEGFSLVYASRSLQSASPAFPRVIVYGPDFQLYTSPTRLVLAFSGDPGKPDYNTLEVLSVDDGSPAIRLTEVRFPGDNSGTPVIEDQPARCAVCHGSPARPIWDSYPVWPGVYGSIDDNVDAGTDEFKNFQDLKPKLGKSGRYLHLPMSSQGTTIVTGSTENLLNTPNLKLTSVLARLNFRRAAAQLVHAPHFQPLKFALLGASAGCFDTLKDGTDWFSANAYGAFGLSLDQVATLMNRDAVTNDQAKLRRFFNVHGKEVPAHPDGNFEGFDISEAPRAAPVRYLSLLAGDDMRGWSMSLTPRAFSFATGAYGIMDFANDLLDALKNDADIAAFLAGGGETAAGDFVQLDCPKLAALSKTAMTDQAAQAIGATAATMTADLASDGIDQQQVILRCMSCHTDPLLDPEGNPTTPAAGQAPYFPLQKPADFGRLVRDDEGALAAKIIAAIMAAPGDEGRMPKAPRAPLTHDEQGALKDLVKILNAGEGPSF